MYRSSQPEMFCKTGVFRNFTKGVVENGVTPSPKQKNKPNYPKKISFVFPKYFLYFEADAIQA